MGGYDPITADIGRKCSEDVSVAIRRNMLLVQDDLSAAQVAVMGAGLGVCNLGQKGAGSRGAGSADARTLGLPALLFDGENGRRVVLSAAWPAGRPCQHPAPCIAALRTGQ